MKKILFLTASVLMSLAIADSPVFAGVTFNTLTPDNAANTTDGSTDNGAIPVTITGGPWTLGQGPTTKNNPSVDYCTPFGTSGVPQPNPGTNLMQPYYYPFVSGSGNNLQGYFDYRPKDTNEAVVAANSTNGGLTWTFQQEVLELNPGVCPSSKSQTNLQSYPAGTTAYPSVLLSAYGASDDGQGHSIVMTIGGVTRLYTIDRSTNADDNSVDNFGLVVHTLIPGGLPLTGVEATSPDTVPNKGQRTNGLFNPDSILAEVPGTNPRVVLYVQKQLGADTTLLPSNQLCPSPTFGYQAGKSPNTDYVTVRLARTSDGINFTDIGPVTGLNDQTTTSETGVRYIASRGTLIRLPNNRYGLFYSGGNCLDADSDAFHFIGYAESSNLRTWTVVNGINNPIASVVSETDPNTGVTIPSTPPLIPTETWFQQRVYTPNAIITGNNEISLIFAGYKVKGPGSDYSNYRTIGQVYLKTSLPLLQF